MRVLVTGGAGYIGSHTVVALIEQGHEVVIVDSFANSSEAVIDRIARITGIRPAVHRIDLRDEEGLRRVFAEAPPEAVVHFGGLKAVGESVAQPLEYYAHNLGSTFALLSVMQDTGVRRLVFSSSATVYGDGHVPPYGEDGGPLHATNPYGQTKVMLEQILVDVARADPTWGIAILRYFNPVGAHPTGLLGESPRGVPNNLAPYVAQVAIGRLPVLGVFGSDYDTRDGTGERDYVHVMDLAEGHVAAVAALDELRGTRAWNLGTGTATSVLDLVAAFERASGRSIPLEFRARRAGDIARAWADPSRAQEELGWRATRGLDEMAADAWRWQQANPDGL